MLALADLQARKGCKVILAQLARRASKVRQDRQVRQVRLARRATPVTAALQVPRDRQVRQDRADLVVQQDLRAPPDRQVQQVLQVLPSRSLASLQISPRCRRRTRPAIPATHTSSRTATCTCGTTSAQRGQTSATSKDHPALRALPARQVRQDPQVRQDHKETPDLQVPQAILEQQEQPGRLGR